MVPETVANFVQKSFEAFPQIEAWGSHQIQGTTGYVYSPQNIRPAGFWTGLYVHGFMNTADKFYLSRPYVDQNSDNTLTVRFMFGVLYGMNAVSYYANVSYVIDQETGEEHLINGESSLRVEFYSNDHSIENIFPATPYSIPILPSPVNTGLTLLRSMRDIGVWFQSLELDDAAARNLQLENYVMMFSNQMVFGIEQAYKSNPTEVFSMVGQVTAFYEQYIRMWPSSTPSVDGDWDGGGLEYSFSCSGAQASDIVFTRPTFFTAGNLWVMVCKFTLDVSGHDDHISIYVLGDFATEDSVNFTVNNVVGVSAVTEYRHAEGNLSNDISTENGEDILQQWSDDFVALNRNKSNDIVNFSSGTVTMLQSLIDSLKETEPQSHPNVIAVNREGNGSVSFAADPSGNVFAGCSGYVYQLNWVDGSVLHNHNIGVANHTVSMFGTSEVLYAGSHGKVVALSTQSALASQWEQTLEDESRTEVLVANDVYVGCSGKVYRLDKSNGDILSCIDLSTVKNASQTRNGDVYLAVSAGLLYCGCNGVVVSFVLATFAADKIWHLYGQNDSDTYVIPTEDGVCASSKGRVYGLGEDIWITDLRDYQSHIGDDDVVLGYTKIDAETSIMAGVNGYVFYLNVEDGSVIRDERSNTYSSVHGNGRGNTSVFSTTGTPLAGCNGKIYYLDRSDYSNEMDVEVGSSGKTSVFSIGGTIFVGWQGYVYLQPLLGAVQ